MIPSLSRSNQVYASLRHFIAFCYVLLKHTVSVQLANFEHIFISKVRPFPAGFAVMFASVCPSAFGKAIELIVEICSNEKMAWPDARRIVALMTNKKLSWLWITGKNPRKTMCPYISTPNRKEAITPRVSSAGPNPASIAFFDIFPKSFRYFFFGPSVSPVTFDRAEFSFAHGKGEELATTF